MSDDEKELPYSDLSYRGKIFAEHHVGNKLFYVTDVPGGVRLGWVYPTKNLDTFQETSFVVKDFLIDWLILQLMSLKHKKMNSDAL